MTKILPILTTFSLLMTTACVSTHYQTPDLKTSLGYTDTIGQHWQRDENWWTAYQDPQLNGLIQTALERNPDYMKTAVTIYQEMARLSLVNSDLFPTLNANLSASAQSAIRRTNDYSSNFAGELGLNYEVDLYGKVRNLQTAQRLQLQAAVQDRESARLSLINSVTDLYFKILYLKNTQKLTLQNIESYESIYKIAEQKYKTGRTDEIETLEAKQSLLSEQTRLSQIETQLKENEAGLKNILGFTPDDILNIADTDLTTQPVLDIDLDVPVSVLAVRPDLKAAQSRLEASFKSLQAEEKNWYPSISVGGSIQSSSDKPRTMFNFPFLAGNVGLNLPFLDWNRVRNNVKISEADYQLTAIGFTDTLTQALNEIAYYDFAYTQSKDELKNIEENYQNAIKITAYYKQRYQYGKVEFRYYLEALNRENSLREEAIAQKYQILKYENYIFKAMGGRYTSKA